MKKHVTRELVNFAPAAAADAAGLPAQPPSGAQWFYGFGGVRHLVAVSFVAKDWGVSSRRIRALLAAGRLEGRRQDNGYWEVYHPYRVVYGLRGPALKRQKKPDRKAE